MRLPHRTSCMPCRGVPRPLTADRRLTAAAPLPLSSSPPLLLSSSPFEFPPVWVGRARVRGWGQVSTTILVQPRDESREMWDGPRTGPQQAPGLLGVNSAGNIDQLMDVVSSAASAASHVYYDLVSPVHRKHNAVITEAVAKAHGTGQCELRRGVRCIRAQRTRNLCTLWGMHVCARGAESGEEENGGVAVASRHIVVETSELSGGGGLRSIDPFHHQSQRSSLCCVAFPTSKCMHTGRPVPAREHRGAAQVREIAHACAHPACRQVASGDCRDAEGSRHQVVLGQAWCRCLVAACLDMCALRRPTAHTFVSRSHSCSCARCCPPGRSGVQLCGDGGRDASKLRRCLGVALRRGRRAMHPARVFTAAWHP